MPTKVSPTTSWSRGVRLELAPIGRNAAADGEAPVLRKTASLAHRYLDLADEFSTANIVELGMFTGGSMVLLALAYPNATIVGFDLENRRKALDRFIAERDLEARLHPCWQVDQADRQAISDHLDQVFATEAIDFVIDDASHLYGPTLASLETLLPRMRPNGLYVIEDWDWQTLWDSWAEQVTAANPDGEFARALHATPPDQTHRLSTLIHELTTLASRRPDIIAEVQLSQGWMQFRRGPATLDVGFRLHDELGTSHEPAIPQSLGQDLLGEVFRMQALAQPPPS